MSSLSPALTLTILSAVIGVLMLFIWRYTSNQAAIADVRRKIAANLLATRLFKDNVAVSFRAQRQIVWQALRLLAHSIRPTIIMAVPFILVMVQIGLRYEHRPALVGQPVRVTATLKPGHAPDGEGDRLSLPDGLSRDRNDPCRAEALRTVDWRITPQRAGVFMLEFGVGQDAIRMPIWSGDRLERLSRQRGGSFWDRLLYSAEPAIPERSIFESITIHYPNRKTPIFGMNIHWLVTLLVLSIFFALLFKPIMKVHI